MKVSYSFTGGPQLEKALAELEKAATRKTAARNALKAAADPILSEYKRNTVVATGILVGSEITGTRLNRRQSRMNRKMGKSEVEVHIGTNDPAGLQQEFGNWHQPAVPALGPAWDSQGGQRAVDRIGDVMGPEIMKAAARQAKRKARGR